MAIENIFAKVEACKESLCNLSVEELKQLMSTHETLLLLDIREIEERIDRGTIPGAVHCARGMLEFWASPDSPYYRDYFQPDRKTVIFCAAGGRSALAARALLDMGFTDVAHLEPGFSGWASSEESIEDVSKSSRWVRRESIEERSQ